MNSGRRSRGWQGQPGLAEYSRILREHSVEHPRGFQASQPARACAKDVFGLLEELRANALENQSELSFRPGAYNG